MCRQSYDGTRGKIHRQSYKRKIFRANFRKMTSSTLACSILCIIQEISQMPVKNVIAMQLFENMHYNALLCSKRIMNHNNRLAVPERERD